MIWKRYRNGLINGKCLLTLASQNNLKRYCFLRKGAKINVCSLQLGPNFGMWLTAYKNFYLPLTIEKIHVLVVVTNIIYGHTVVVAPILRLQLALQIQKLECKLKSSKHKSLQIIQIIQIYFLIKRIFLLNGKLVG